MNIKEIVLCDCTLKHGGYTFNGEFGRAFINNVVKKIPKSGVEFCDIGYLKNEPFRYERTVYNSLEPITALLKNSENCKCYIVTIDMQSPLPLENLDNCSARGIQKIRVMFQKRNSDIAYEYCQQLISKGYQLLIHPQNTYQYSTEEFTEIIQKFSLGNICAFYVDDSFSALNREELIGYLAMADRYVSPNILLGYNGSNGRGELLGMIRTLLDTTKFDHQILLDASLSGMGKGAGMLNEELLADYLNEHHGCSYSLETLVGLYNNDLKRTHWDKCYSLKYFIAAKHKIDPAYVEFWSEERNTSAKELTEIIQLMPEKERTQYTEQKAKDYFRKFAKDKMNMAVVIPTANRATAIDHLLYMSAHQFKRYGIDIIIYDSSEDRKTEAVTKNFIIDGCDNVIYTRYLGEFDGFSLDHKVIAAYQQFADDYEYLWICRDGLIISIDECYEALLKLIQEKNEYIVVDAAFRSDVENEYVKQYTDCRDFFKDHAQRIVTLGTLILSSKMALTLIEKYPIDQSNYTLWQMIVPFHHYAKNMVKAVCYFGNVFFYNVAGTSNSFWNGAGKAMRQWADRWFHAIKVLPEIYEPYKAKVLQLDMVDFHPFYLASLLRMRANGGLNVKLINQYKQYFSFVCKTKIWKFYLAALIPIFLAQYIINFQGTRLVRIITNMYHFCIGMVPGEGRFNERV